MSKDQTHRSSLSEILTTGVAVLVLVASAGLLGAIGYAVWQFASSIPRILNTTSPEVLAAAIVTSGTILVALIAHIAERVFSKNRDISEAHRSHKIDIYKGFFDNVIQFLQTSAKDSEKNAHRNQDKLVRYIREFNRDSILWASPRVIKLYKQMSLVASSNPYQAMIIMDDLMREIRKDLGHSNKGLEKGDLWKMFLNDPEEFDKVLRGESLEDKGASVSPII